MKRVLLTGVGGSIGIHTLAHIFTNTDWEIVGTDSFRHKGWTDRLVVMFKSHPDWKDRFTLITHELTAPFSEITKKKIGHIDSVALSQIDEGLRLSMDL